MKTLAPIVTLIAAIAMTTGCDSKKEPTVPTSPETPKTSASPASSDAQKALTDAAADAQKTAATAATEVQKAAEPVKAAAQTAVAETTKSAQSSVATATAKAQATIDKAKALVADNKFQEGLTMLNGLAGMVLTPEQQKMVDDLKVTIQKAMSSKAGQAVGNILGGGTK